MKIGSRGLLILAATWLVVSLLWFLWVKNTVIGVVWLCLGIVELIIALRSKTKEQK